MTFKEYILRPGKQEDMLTMSVGYDYLSKKSENYDGLIQFLEDIQPNKLERDYLLTYLATALFGNLLELFTILIVLQLIHIYLVTNFTSKTLRRNKFMKELQKYLDIKMIRFENSITNGIENLVLKK